MTQHYGIRQLAFRKGWSYTLAYAGANMFISSWSVNSPLTVIIGIFITVFTLYYFGNMLRYHKWHAINWFALGIIVSALIAGGILFLSSRHSSFVDGTPFDEMNWTKTIKVPYAETRFAIIEAGAAGLCFAITFGMIGLSNSFFKATSGVFFGIALGFTPMFTFIIQHLRNGYAISDSIMSSLPFLFQTIGWIACMSSIVAAILALGDRCINIYNSVMSYENSDYD